MKKRRYMVIVRKIFTQKALAIRADLKTKQICTITR